MSRYKYKDMTGKPHNCEDCIHNDKPWYELPCDACCTAHSGYEGRHMSRYIDADKLKEAWYTKHNITEEDCGACFVGYSELPRLIDNQPTADVRENVRGEWREENPREKSMMWRCSVCGRIAYYPTIGERKNYKKHCGYNYCPNCGADMRGGDAK